MSIGIMPVTTSTCCQNNRSGKTSGAPLPPGSVMSRSPIRNIVCDHDPRNPPKRAASPLFSPLLLKLSAITSGWVVSSTEKMFSAAGRSARV